MTGWQLLESLRDKAQFAYLPFNKTDYLLIGPDPTDPSAKIRYVRNDSIESRPGLAHVSESVAPPWLQDTVADALVVVTQDVAQVGVNDKDVMVVFEASPRVSAVTDVKGEVRKLAINSDKDVEGAVAKPSVEAAAIKGMELALELILAELGQARPESPETDESEGDDAG